MQYIVSLRITNAINLIENTDYNITEIANAVGYDNSLYFSRLFHKHTGIHQVNTRKNIKSKV